MSHFWGPANLTPEHEARRRAVKCCKQYALTASTARLETTRSGDCAFAGEYLWLTKAGVTRHWLYFAIWNLPVYMSRLGGQTKRAVNNSLVRLSIKRLVVELRAQVIRWNATGSGSTWGGGKKSKILSSNQSTDSNANVSAEANNRACWVIGRLASCCWKYRATSMRAPSQFFSQQGAVRASKDFSAGLNILKKSLFSQNITIKVPSIACFLLVILSIWSRCFHRCISLLSFYPIMFQRACVVRFLWNYPEAFWNDIAGSCALLVIGLAASWL